MGVRLAGQDVTRPTGTPEPVQAPDSPRPVAEVPQAATPAVQPAPEEPAAASPRRGGPAGQRRELAREGAAARERLTGQLAGAGGAEGAARAMVDQLTTQLGVNTDANPAAAPPGAAPVAAAGGPSPAQLETARRLVRAGGSGTAQDVEAVVQSLAQAPVDMLQRMEKRGVRVVACRGSITDYRTDLRGTAPRGWPPGSTWDSVPGVYTPDRKEVIIATEERRGQRAISARHGSFDMVLHETGHGLDFRNALGEDSTSRAFRAAYDADKPLLERNHASYYLQPAPAGPQEAYAETFARYSRRDPTLAREYPGMYRYWQDLEARISARRP